LVIEISEPQGIISKSVGTFHNEVQGGEAEFMMLSKAKCFDYIDSLAQMGILEISRDPRGEERVELKVPLEELVREALEREGGKPPENRREFPEWICLTISKTVLKQRQFVFSKEDQLGVAAVFMGIICLQFGEDAFDASLKLLGAAHKARSTARN